MASVLVVGGGGREHALVDAFRRSASAPHVIAAPGNAGIAAEAEVSSVAADDVEGLTALARARRVELVVVGPEVPLVAGLADRLRAHGVPVLGPSAAAAQLEGSKAFAKTIMMEAGVPTARWGAFHEVEPALAFAASLGGVAVVKADGLAAGKGVVVASDAAETEAAIRSVLAGAFGSAGHRVVVEERLQGEELSVIALTDGERIAVLAPSQDHKRAFDGDLGPNTGGMGAYSPAPRATPAILEEVERRCLAPVVARLKERGTPFSGVLYAGIMLTPDGIRVLEYNVRFGDPETQVILPRLAVDAYALMRAAAAGELSGGPVACSASHAITVVMAAEGYPASPKKGEVITGLDEAAALPDVRVFHAGTRRNARGEVVTSGGRVLNVTALGPNLSAAAARAYEAVARIEFKGAHYRRDIGHRALGPDGSAR